MFEIKGACTAPTFYALHDSVKTTSHTRDKNTFKSRG